METLIVKIFGIEIDLCKKSDAVLKSYASERKIKGWKLMNREELLTACAQDISK